MIRMHKLVPLVGGLLLSKGGRRMAGRHAGKLALATMPKPRIGSHNMSSGNDADNSRPCSMPPLPLKGAVSRPKFLTGAEPGGGT